LVAVPAVRPALRLLRFGRHKRLPDGKHRGCSPRSSLDRRSALRLRRAVLHRPYRCSISSALCRCVSVRSITVEKHELSKVEFEIIDKALKALLQSNLDPLTADKVTDLRNMFQDAFTGWLEIDQEAA